MVTSQGTPWNVTFIGTGALLGSPFRAFPATLVETHSATYLFDCGDGAAERLRREGKRVVDVVAVTEVSSETVSGILMLAEYVRRSTRAPLKVIGPAGLRTALLALSSVAAGDMDAVFEFSEAIPGVVAREHAGEYLEAITVEKAEPAKRLGYLLYEAPVPGRIDAEKATRLGIRGAEFALIKSGVPVRGIRPSDVMDPPTAGRRVVVVGHGRPTAELSDALRNADVAILPAPFMDERLELARRSGYMTGWEAASLAADSKVKICMLTRLGPYAPAWVQLAEARQFNHAVEAPNDLQVLRVPLPSRGAPHFARSPKRGGT